MGVLLVILPWSSLWDRNVVFDLVPALEILARTGYLRGAVSGLGIVNVGIGIAELLAVWHDRGGTLGTGRLGGAERAREGRAGS